MKSISLLSTLFASLLFVSCGENTTAPIHDVSSLKINDTNISIYSTDTNSILSATIFYDDNSSAQATTELAWSSSNNNIVYAYTNTITPTANGGDVNISAQYDGKFADSVSAHVKQLLSLSYTDINTSDTSNAQTISVYGNFENNETNVSMQNNITWYCDANMTISESNSTQVTFTIQSLPTTLTARLFGNTINQVDFNISY
jgi:hypothetical protein